MSLSDLRQHLTENVYYSTDYFGKEITYTPKGGVAKTFDSIPNLTESNSGFDMSNEHKKRVGTFAVPKAQITAPKRGDRIVYDSSDFLVMGLETENDLNFMVSVEEQVQNSTGGIIKE